MTVTVERESAPIPEVAPVVTGTLRTADHTGDTTLTWDRNNAEEVEIARASFRASKDKGYLAYKVGRGGSDNELLRAFDPAAESIVMMPQTVGG